MKHEVVTREAWNERRQELLEKEKAFTRQRDRLSELRRQLPWVRVDKDYRFDSVHGELSLSDLFDGRSQLIIYHFMFGPDWKEGCPSCSFWADNYNGIIIHLHQRDVTLIGVSNAPLDKLLAFQKRLGWTFPWVSSLGSDFNFDFEVSVREGEPSTYNFKPVPAGAAREMPGISVFLKDEDGSVYHTYSTYGRGLEDMNTAYRYLDIVPKGRDEDGLPYSMAWVKIRDQYGRDRQDSIDLI